MEPDGIEEAVNGQIRVLVTAAGQAGERIARIREDQHRRREAQSAHEARQLQSRLEAERLTARAELSKAHRASWWDSATPENIAYTYQVARAWSNEDPEAVRVEEKIRTELKTRYGLDVDNLGADPQAVQNAVNRATNNYGAAKVEQRRSREEQTEAQLLLAAVNREETLDSLNPTGTINTEYGPQHRATAPLAPNMVTLSQTQQMGDTDMVTIYRGLPVEAEQKINPGDYITTNYQLAADYAGTGNVIEEEVPAAHVLDDLNEPGGEEYIYRPPTTPTSSSSRHEQYVEDSKNTYDSAQRRATMASELEANGIEQEVIATRLRADISQAKPATEATRTVPNTRNKRGKKPRNHGRGPQSQRTGLSK